MIDDLSFLLNSLPPYNGSASFANTSLPALLPIVTGTRPPVSCGPGVPALHHIRSPGCPARRETPRSTNGTSPSSSSWTGIWHCAAYVGSFGYHGLLNIDPNSIPAQICSTAGGCQAGGNGAARSTVAQGAEYIPVSATRPNQYVGAGFFWYTEGNSSYNSLQIDLTRRFSRGLEFGPLTHGQGLDINSALTGAQANNQAQMVMNRNDVRRDWGPSALNAAHQASFSARYELPLAAESDGWGTRTGRRKAGGRVAIECHHDTAQRFSDHSASWVEPVRGWGYGDPDRPSLNPAFTGAVKVESPNQLVQSECVRPAARWDVWKPRPGNPDRSGTRRSLDLSLFKNVSLTERLRLQIRAEFFNALNHFEFRNSECHCVFQWGAEFDGGTDYKHCDDPRDRFSLA